MLVSASTKCSMISYDAGQDMQAKFPDLHNDSLKFEFCLATHDSAGIISV